MMLCNANDVMPFLIKGNIRDVTGRLLTMSKNDQESQESEQEPAKTYI